MKKTKKLIAMLLAVMMLLSILHMAAFADGPETTLMVDCKTYHGTGKVLCDECRGTCIYPYPCDMCGGTGKDPDQPEENCHMCDGKGKQPCDVCYRTGYLDCDDCKSSGKVKVYAVTLSSANGSLNAVTPPYYTANGINYYKIRTLEYITISFSPAVGFELVESSIKAINSSTQEPIEIVKASKGYMFLMPEVPVEIQADFAHAHTFADTWSSDANGHWHACTATGCNIEDYATCGVAGAAYSTHADENEDGLCDVCEYAINLATYKASKIAEIKAFGTEGNKIPAANKETQSYKNVISHYEAEINNAETKEDIDTLTAQALKALDEFVPEIHDVKVNGGATVVSKELIPAKSTKYEVVTVKIKEDDGIRKDDGQWFVYWVDGDGNIISTYSTYEFVVVKDIELTPVYVSSDAYDAARAEAVIASNVVRADDNKDGTATLFAEHSASKAAVGNAILQHGIIWTTDEAQMNNLTLENDSVKKAVAQSTKTDLTGLLRVTVNANGAGTVYVCSFITDAEDNTTYGDVETV